MLVTVRAPILSMVTLLPLLSTVEPFLHVTSGKGSPCTERGIEIMPRVSPITGTIYVAIGCGSSMVGDTVMHVC